jgi:hypothetical protein
MLSLCIPFRCCCFALVEPGFYRSLTKWNIPSSWWGGTEARYLMACFTCFTVARIFCFMKMEKIGFVDQGCQCHTRVYPKVSGLAAWSEKCKWYSSLPLDAVVSLFCESV